MLKVIDKDLVKLINEPLDPALIRRNYGGEKYITGYTVVRLLNKITNGAWDFSIDKTWTEKCSDKKGEHDIYHMTVTLRCLFDDGNGHIIELKKPGTAGKVLEAGAKNASNIYKSLETLCVRKAASYFGIGAELWRNDDEVDYFENDDFEPIWTEELMKQYSDDWNAIAKIQQDTQLTDDEMNNLVSMWKKEYAALDRIQPDDLPKFVEYLQKQLEEGAEE